MKNHEQLNIFTDAIRQAELTEVNPTGIIELNKLALLKEMADSLYPSRSQ